MTRGGGDSDDRVRAETPLLSQPQSQSTPRQRRALNVREVSYMHTYVVEGITNNISLRSTLTLLLGPHQSDRDRQRRAARGDDYGTANVDYYDLSSDLLARVHAALELVQRKHPLLRSHATMEASPTTTVGDEFHFEELSHEMIETIPVRLLQVENEELLAITLQERAIEEMEREFRVNCDDRLVRITVVYATPVAASSQDGSEEVKVGVLFSMPHFAFDGKNSLAIFKDFIECLDQHNEEEKRTFAPIKQNVNQRLRDKSFESVTSFLLFVWELLCVVAWLLMNRPKTLHNLNGSNFNASELKTFSTSDNNAAKMLLSYRKLSQSETEALVAKCKSHKVSVTALLIAISGHVNQQHIESNNDAIFGAIAVDLRSRLGVSDDVNGVMNFFVLLTDKENDTREGDDEAKIWKRANRIHKQIQTKVTDGSVFRQLPIVMTSQTASEKKRKQEQLDMNNNNSKKSLSFVDSLFLLAFAVSNLGVYEMKKNSVVKNVTDTYILSTPSYSLKRAGVVEVTTITMNGELGVSFAGVWPYLSRNVFSEYERLFMNTLRRIQ
eukprot:TRINITY_DN8180_c0_g1_i1.p1 TRINITY_DN8180_c0_g1~~TRINITY_DN8180_c0_g1_i1.p1  ORF type:complete len:554 (+),score=136.81 TRINITY_DN8180_c0_g1_i1:98-1759(+)